MPYSVNLKRYTFLINQQTELIMELFNKACDQHYKLNNKDDRLSSDLQITDKQMRKGFIPKLLSGLENLNEKKYGANYVILNPIDYLKLDPKADKIIDTFTNELNSIFKKNNLKSYDLNQTEYIDSPALIFRILLLRLLTIALSNDNTYLRDGEILLKIYSDFINNVLEHVNEFGSEKEIFTYFSTKEHLDWMNEIRQVVLAVKLIHSHQDTVTECLTTVKSLSYTIQRMIIAYLRIADKQCEWSSFRLPKINPTDLEDSFIENRLNEYEIYLAHKNSKNNIKDINQITNAIDIMTFAAIEHLGRHKKTKLILDNINICDNSHIAALIACKNNHCPDKVYQKLEALYALYFKSRCLLISLEQIDELLTTCSWVPLVTGMINLSQICELIRIHSESCGHLLAISNTDEINKLSFKQIIMQKCFHAQAQLTEMNSRIRALEELQSSTKLEKIKYEITENINNLLVVQSALNICIMQHFATNNQFEDRPNLSINNFNNPSIEYSPQKPKLLLTNQPSRHTSETHQFFSTNPNISSKSEVAKQKTAWIQGMR